MVLGIIRSALASVSVATGFTPLVALALVGGVGVLLWSMTGSGSSTQTTQENDSTGGGVRD